MRFIFFVATLLLLFNGCTNRYESPTAVSYKPKTTIVKKEVKEKTVKYSSKKVAQKRDYYVKKSQSKRKKRIVKRVAKIDKTLLKADYLKYSYNDLTKNIFNKRTLLSKLVKIDKVKYVKKATKKRAKVAKVSDNKKKKRKLYLTATAYTSHKDQTDSTPFLAAWNNKIRPGMKIVAVSHDLIKEYGLDNGVKVKIKGLKGDYVVKDKMNKRFKKRIDIYMGLNKKRALEWGKRKVVLYY